MGFSRSGIVKGAALAACAVAAVSCGSTGGSTGVGTAESASTPSATVTVLPPLTRTSSAPAPAPDRTETKTVTVPAQQPNDQPANSNTTVPCVDPNSDNVRSAVAGLGTDSQGGGFRIIGYTGGNSADGCPTLEWALAQGTGIQDATSQYHVLFFTNRGDYLGTATSYPYSYTDVVDSSDTRATVHYKWLGPNDAFCCPSNESYVDFTLDGNKITPSGQFPPRP